MRGKIIWYCCCLCLFICRDAKVMSKKRAELPDMFDKGTIHISCDESFKPVIDEEVKVYEALYPDTKIIVHYKPEAECLKDFEVDSIRMVIATRGYSESEENFMIDSMHVHRPNW